MFVSALVLIAAIASPPIPTDAARRALEDTRIASEEDGGKLWGKALYGPLMLVDPQTRYVVANQADSEQTLRPLDTPAGRMPLFAGTLPADVVIANTATSWHGAKWTMVMWGSVSSVSAARRRLLIHECFHRIQDDLGLPATNANNPHLDKLDGRYWFLLELRALSAALRNANRQQAIADALAFRAKRRELFANAAAAERALEMNEGLAEYTGFALRGTGAAETRLSFAQRLDDINRGDSFVRSFAYNTGPAYGLLLDVLNPQWRTSLKSDSDFGALLGAAAKVTPSDANARAAAYSGAALRADEEKRARDLAERVARYKAKLVDGPVIEIPLEGAHYGFDPYAVVSADEIGTIYPALEVTGDWGRITTETGARLDSARGLLVLSADDRAKLTLNSGWTLKPGSRASDLVLSRE